MPAADPIPAYEPRPAGFRPEQIFCFKYERVVRPDNTIPFGGRVIQLLPACDRRRWVRARVEVHAHFNGQLVIHEEDGVRLPFVRCTLPNFVVREPRR